MPNIDMRTIPIPGAGERKRRETASSDKAAELHFKKTDPDEVFKSDIRFHVREEGRFIGTLNKAIEHRDNLKDKLSEMEIEASNLKAYSLSKGEMNARLPKLRQQIAFMPEAIEAAEISIKTATDRLDYHRRRALKPPAHEAAR